MGEIIFEEKRTYLDTKTCRKLILDFLKSNMEWNNTKQVANSIKVNYVTVKNHLEHMRDSNQVEKMNVPYGNRQMTLWKAKLKK